MKAGAALVFGSKAETLDAVRGALTSATVLPQVRFTVDEWRHNAAAVLARVDPSWLERPLIVRSSALSEDRDGASLAGKFASRLDVAGREAVVRAVGEVILSFDAARGGLPRGGDPRGGDQVFIQPMVEDVALSGVALSRDQATEGHYYVVSFDDRSGRTDTVTSGRPDPRAHYDVRTHYYDKTDWGALRTPLRGPAAPIVPVLAELEVLFHHDALDVEFAIDRGGTVYVLQVRPLPLAGECRVSLEAHRDVLDRIEQKIRQLGKPHPYLKGDHTVFGVMPDWNPAEIIGIRPRPLAFSLYKELVTDAIWAYQRHNYGYRNVRSFPLLQSFGGQPYVDVRVSFNSFVPATLDERLAERLVNYYVDRLRESPTHHDKVEFEIIFSCYSLDLPERLAVLREHGFPSSDIDAIGDSLRELTTAIIHRDAGLWKDDTQKIAELERRQATLIESELHPLAKIYWLIEDCKRFGTLPFAGLARAGFIAVQMLRSAVACGVLTETDYERFLRSIDTVSSRMAHDLDRLSSSAFLERYGHLRPGTYDVLSPRYDQDPDRYFAEMAPEPRAEPSPAFALSLEQLNRLRDLLEDQRIGHDPLSLLNFIKGAIEGREYAKFVFTRSLSECMEVLTELGGTLGYTRDDLSYLDIGVIQQLYTRSDEPREAFEHSIVKGRRLYEITRRLTLPPLIVDASDVRSFELPVNEPTYVTLKSFSGSVVAEGAGPERLRQAVLLLPSADPGYDWIFSHGIGSFITMYGGANSHMAIRAGELGIPAVIGAGELLFRQWSAAERLEIDCANKTVRVVR